MVEQVRNLDAEANQVATRYMGTFAWPTVVFALVVFVSYLTIYGAAMTENLSLIWALGLQSLVVYASYTVLHETVHGNVSGTRRDLRWVNDALGYVAGFIMGIPYTMHKGEHFTHHRNTNDAASDPDAAFAAQNLVGVFVASLKTINIQFRFYFTSEWPKAPTRERVVAVIELTVIVLGRVGLAIAGFPLEALVLGVVANLIGTFITATFFAWLVHHPHTVTGRYVDTGTFVFPRWINGVVTHLWLFQNYHSIHHLFPRIPFYRYADVFDEIRGVMEAKGAPIHDIGAARHPNRVVG